MNILMESTPRYEIRKLQTNFPIVKITKSKDAANFIRQFYTDDIGIFESFFLLCLDIAHNTIGYRKISQGGVTMTVVDAKIVAKFAIEDVASMVIVAHNHPSGNLTPSEQDKQLTKKLKEGLALLDIGVMDHIILTEDSYLSMADEGLI